MNYDALIGCRIEFKNDDSIGGICVGYHQNLNVQNNNTTITWFTYLKDNGELGYIKYRDILIHKDQHKKLFNNIKKIQEKKFTRNELLDFDK